MLNYKGRYYASGVLENINSIKNNLLNLGILKTSDLGEPNSFSPISNITLTEFWSNTEANINVRGFSEEIIKNIRAMGDSNISHKDMVETRKFYSELKSIYDSSSISLKGFEYFKLFYRYNYLVSKELKNAIEKARQGIDVPQTPQGASFTFQTSEDNILVMPNIKDDFYKVKNVLSKNVDFNTIGIKLPSKDELTQDHKYIQIDANDILFNRDNVIVNIAYTSADDLKTKSFPVVSTYKNKQLEIVGLLSKAELMKVLKDDYSANVSNKLFDTEVFYEAIERFTMQQANQRPVCLLTGKKQLSYISVCENKRSWPSSVLNAKSVDEVINNTYLMSPRMVRAYHTRNTEKARKVA